MVFQMSYKFQNRLWRMLAPWKGNCICVDHYPSHPNLIPFIPTTSPQLISICHGSSLAGLVESLAHTRSKISRVCQRHKDHHRTPILAKRNNSIVSKRGIEVKRSDNAIYPLRQGYILPKRSETVRVRGPFGFEGRQSTNARLIHAKPKSRSEEAIEPFVGRIRGHRVSRQPTLVASISSAFNCFYCVSNFMQHQQSWEG